MKFFVLNLGCKVNRVESDSMQAAFLARGHELSALEDAAVVVVNTCTVTGEAEKKTRKAVRRALREAPEAIVVVTGCAASISPDVFSEMDADRVVVEPDKSAALDAALDALSPDERIWAGPEQEADAALRMGSHFPTRVGIKVQDGCNNACTYCIVHVARGRAWSRPADQVVAEAVAYAKAGVKEIVLTGINLGSYCDGDKRDSESLRLAGLLRRLLEETAGVAEGPDVRFRVSSVEPRDVDDDFVRVLSESQGRVCRHLHLPLQSGSSRVLKEMARPYDAPRFAALVAKLRESVPELSLTTDIIVGFPGETEEDFQETLSMVEVCRFSKVHAFPYSRREGTPAAARPDQVSPEVKSERMARLAKAEAASRAADIAFREDGLEWVLVEEGGRGMTESHYEIEVPDGHESGSLVRLPLKGVLS